MTPIAPALRKIKALPINGIDIAPVKAVKPVCQWVKPADLFVEERYQRNIAENSITLIRKIIRNWDWGRMKPPICARDAEGNLFVVDGQHTAIAAASHPEIDKIPVMVLDLAGVANRASAFIGHNRDRLAMTPMQLYYAALAAGDEVAVAMAEACKRAGVSIRKSAPPNGIYQDGDTLAVGAIRDVVSKKGAPGGARVLKILKDVGRKPITAQEIKAVGGVLWNYNWLELVNEFDLATLIRSKAPDAWESLAETQVRKGMKMVSRSTVERDIP